MNTPYGRLFWLRYRLRYIWYVVEGMYYVLLLERLVCSRWGHDIVDDGSYATPESAADHLRCDRCWQSWSHAYY
jgi:hypothetical protein